MDSLLRTAAWALLACAAPTFARAADTPAQARPNVLLVLVDDLGYGDLGCQGSTQIPTPALDALAAGGVRALQAYTTAPVCSPSRAGLLTGRYGNRFGFEANVFGQHGLPGDERTLADRLRALGYRTAAIGKWHLGVRDVHHPLERGFDRFFGMPAGHSYFPRAERNQLARDRAPVTEVRTPYLTDWLTLEAIDFVSAADPERRPWFLYLAYNAPHVPLEATPLDLARFADVQPRERATYCAMVANLDANVGRLVDVLRGSGQLDDTLIVFLNDNGGDCDQGACNAPLRGQKGTFLEGGLRVPLVLHWPGHLPAGTEFPHPVTSLDVVPTVLAAAGGSVERAPREGPDAPLLADGVDLLPYLTGAADGRPHARLFWRMSLIGAAYREGDWKLLRLPHRPPQLYQLARDPAELHDLAAEEPERVRRMFTTLHRWECTFERNPQFQSPVGWGTHTRRLYEREYALEQPR